MIERRWELKPGVMVIASDGSGGHVSHMFLDAVRRLVVALVVRTDDPFARSVVLPLTQVSDATDREIHLRISHSMVRALPPFYPRRYSHFTEGPDADFGKVSLAGYCGSGGQSPAALAAPARVQQCQARPGVLAKYVLFQGSKRVLCRDRQAGHLALLLLTPQGYIRHLVVRCRRGLSWRRIMVPVNCIDAINQDGVWLNIDHHALAALPDYRSDQEITAAVETALWNNQVLSRRDYRDIAVTVSEGVVVLNGYVRSAVSKQQAEQEARQVHGVQAVENHIVSDGEVVRTVTQALAAHFAVPWPVHVYAVQGVVYLSGNVPHLEQRRAVEACVAEVATVRAIVNHLQVPGLSIDPDDNRVLQPRIGQDVYAHDQRLGHVKRVIISPRNRRVIAVVVLGVFPSERWNTPQEHKRRIVIPMGAVQSVTASGMMLHLSAAQTARYDDFTLDDFIAPHETWSPPYPYRQAEVLWEQQGFEASFRHHPLARSVAHTEREHASEETVLILETVGSP